MPDWERTPQKECGVIVGCDNAQEWLLEWWWERYHAENDYPVTFVDMGMSEAKHNWCSERGEIIRLDLDASFVKSRNDIDSKLVDQWDSLPYIWNSRNAWFKKPFALLLSPYERTVWLDLDCEVLGSLHGLFSQYAQCELAMAREHRSDNLPLGHPDIVYNGGVIVFQHGFFLIQKWAEDALTRNHQFLGDDFLLSALVYETGYAMLELPQIYNWRIVHGISLNAVIVHWVGKKNFIKKCGGVKPALEDFYRAWNR
jgi:hypothetical protein